MVARRRPRRVCGRRECDCARSLGHIFCRECEGRLPSWLRARLFAATRDGNPGEIARLTFAAVEHLAGRTPAIDPRTAMIAAICGDRD